MVPIYALDSLFSFAFPQTALFVDMARDCYEAYVVYLFLALLLAYLGGDGQVSIEQAEEAMATYAESLPDTPYPFPMNFCCPSATLPKGRQFLTCVFFL